MESGADSFRSYFCAKTPQCEAVGTGRHQGCPVVPLILNPSSSKQQTNGVNHVMLHLPILQIPGRSADIVINIASCEAMVVGDISVSRNDRRSGLHPGAPSVLHTSVRIVPLPWFWQVFK